MNQPNNGYWEALRLSYRKVMIVLLVVLYTSCTGQQPSKPDHTISKANTSSMCNVYETSDWLVQLDRMDGSEEMFSLKITGQVNLPSPGYTISWRMGIIDRARPPGQRITLVALEPNDNISAQVITRKDVVFQQEVPFSAYSHISIYCGDNLLERIEDIQVNQ